MTKDKTVTMSRELLGEVEELLNDMLKDDDQTAHWFAQRINACLDKVKELNQ